MEENLISFPLPSTNVTEKFNKSEMFFAVKAKAIWFVSGPTSSLSEKTACDLFNCPLIMSQSLILVRQHTANVLSRFCFINAFFALFNPFEMSKITSVSFSILELNKRLSKANYIYNFCILLVAVLQRLN